MWMPGPLSKNIRMLWKKKEVIPLIKLVDEIRSLVKDVYGDDYDAAPVSTCEAGIWVAFDVLFSPLCKVVRLLPSSQLSHMKNICIIMEVMEDHFLEDLKIS